MSICSWHLRNQTPPDRWGKGQTARTGRLEPKRFQQQLLHGLIGQICINAVMNTGESAEPRHESLLLSMHKF
jgi:hypothetical protein